MRLLVAAFLLVVPALAPATLGGTLATRTESFAVVTADGLTVEGVLVYPATGYPSALVVFAHGYGQTVRGAWLDHMHETAGHGAAVVAVDYRDNLGFPVLRGAEDANAAAKAAFARFPQVPCVYLLGVSMGGAVSGVAIAERPHRVGPPCVPDAFGVRERPLYDGWIDVEGVSDLFETYYEARAVGHPAQAGIERDAGGPAESVPEEYVRRSPALRAGEMRIPWAVVVHAVDDGTVPYDQGALMAGALRRAGVPVESHGVLREKAGQDEGTTGTAVLAGASPVALSVRGERDPSEVAGLHLAGHAWEGDRGSTVMTVALERLFSLLHGGCTPKDGAYTHDLGEATRVVGC